MPSLQYPLGSLYVCSKDTYCESERERERVSGLSNSILVSEWTHEKRGKEDIPCLTLIDLVGKI